MEKAEKIEDPELEDLTLENLSGGKIIEGFNLGLRELARAMSESGSKADGAIALVIRARPDDKKDSEKIDFDATIQVKPPRQNLGTHSGFRTRGTVGLQTNRQGDLLEEVPGGESDSEEDED